MFSLSFDAVVGGASKRREFDAPRRQQVARQQVARQQVARQQVARQQVARQQVARQQVREFWQENWVLCSHLRIVLRPTKRFYACGNNPSPSGEFNKEQIFIFSSDNISACIRHKPTKFRGWTLIFLRKIRHKFFFVTIKLTFRFHLYCAFWIVYCKRGNRQLPYHFP